MWNRQMFDSLGHVRSSGSGVSGMKRYCQWYTLLRLDLLGFPPLHSRIQVSDRYHEPFPEEL